MRKYLRSQAEPGYAPRPEHPRKLDPFKAYIEERIKAARPHWIPALVIEREICAPAIGVVSGRCAILSRAPAQPRPDPVVCFETLPDQQMQTDWGVFRRGKASLSAFVATLGWSRYSYVEFVTDERFETLKRCHESALAATSSDNPPGASASRESGD